MAYPGIVLAIMAGVAVGSMLYYIFSDPTPQAQHQYSPPISMDRALPAPPTRSRSGSRCVRRRRLSSTGRKSSNTDGGRENIEDCTICCDNIFNCESTPVEIPCNHYFHRSCIKKWLERQRSCPNCKKAVPDDIQL